MIAHKHITAIVAILTAIAFALSFCAVIFQDRLRELAGDTGITMDYETELFDTSEPMTVNILMDQDDWDTMLDNAASEEYYECDVEINGETYYHVGIRPKGNTSLTSIASDPDTDRFSLKLEFGHFVEGQTCHGLDKLILNNNYADATNMKEALIYDMYQYMGVDASLYNYASISVNGSYWGVYLALEAVEDSFMLRNYGTKNGDLYKPDSLNIGGAMDGADFDAEDFDFSSMDFGDMDFSSMDFGDMDFSNMTPPDNADGSFDPSSFSGDLSGGFSFGESTDGDAAAEDSTMEAPDAEDAADAEAGTAESIDTAAEDSAAEGSAAEEAGRTVPDTSEMPDPGEMGDFDTSSFSFGGFSMGGSGANLNYTDDDLDSYSTIWEGAVTDSGKVDHQRVVKALKNVSEGTDLESTLDVDNILRYMAVHVFSVNDDSLTGAMAHNYYLYESDGQLNMIPWDYNLSFGGMGSSNDASSVVNDAIDDAFTGTDFFDTLMEDEEYHEEYYEYLLELVDGYINGGGFDAFYERVRSQIDTLVEEDPTAFYTYEEYLTAVETLYDVVKLRGESIERQVDGSIASYASDRSDADDLVDASEIDLSALGSMNTGNSSGGFGGFGGMSFTGADSNSDAASEDAADDSGGTEAADSGQTDDTAGADDADAADSEEDAAAQPGELPDDFDASQFSGGSLPDGFDTSQFSGGSLPDDFDASQFSGDMPEGFDASQFSGDMPEGFDVSQFSGSQSQDTTDAAEDAADDAENAEDAENTADAPTDAEKPADAQAAEPEDANPAEETADSAAEPDESSTAEATDGEAAAVPETPDGGEGFTMPDGGSSRSGLRVSSTTMLYYGISLGFLVIGFAVVLLYRRRKRK